MEKSKSDPINNSSNNQTINHNHPIIKIIINKPIHHNSNKIHNSTQNSNQTTLNDTNYNNTQNKTTITECNVKK